MVTNTVFILCSYFHRGRERAVEFSTFNAELNVENPTAHSLNAFEIFAVE